MKKFSALLAICGLFLVTGCQEEQPVGGSVGSSTPVVNIDESPNDCCVQPDDFPDEPEPEEPTVTEEPLLEVADGAVSGSDEG
ncbi:MAG: hypothetical protein H8E37_05980 [Planctomycetes bacterium]|nr:hypothetical protein [Planctomycetota bacterium]